MEIVNQKEIEKIVEYLKNGKVVCFKTDTIYGFSCDARNELACKRIVEAKERENKPMICMIGKNCDLSLYIQNLTDYKQQIINNLWPNPITIIFESKYNFNEYVSCNKNTIGFRYPKNDFCEQILNSLDFPIVTTSVNKTGEKSINEVSEIITKFSNQIDLLVDCGRVENVLPSTIVDATQDFKVIREGVISETEILKRISKVKK